MTRTYATLSDYPIVVVVFGMEGCPACGEYIPRFRQVAQAWGPRVPSFVVEAYAQAEAADFYKISDLPTTLVLRYGAVVGYPHVGAVDTAEIDDIFRLASTWV